MKNPFFKSIWFYNKPHTIPAGGQKGKNVPWDFSHFKFFFLRWNRNFTLKTWKNQSWWKSKKNELMGIPVPTTVQKLWVKFGVENMIPQYKFNQNETQWPQRQFIPFCGIAKLPKIESTWRDKKNELLHDFWPFTDQKLYVKFQKNGAFPSTFERKSGPTASKTGPVTTWTPVIKENVGVWDKNMAGAPRRVFLQGSKCSLPSIIIAGGL